MGIMKVDKPSPFMKIVNQLRDTDKYLDIYIFYFIVSINYIK